MRAFRLFLCLVLVVLGVLVVAGPAQASGASGGDDRDCRKVDARGVGLDAGDGTTTATITRDPLLKGTTAASFSITGGSPPVLTFAGTVVFTTKRGTLTVAIAGTFNVATGAFDASGPVASGTGRFDGATGNLRLVGVEDFTTGRFTETVRGTICPGDDEDDD